MVMVDEDKGKLFYSGDKIDGIYQHFRNKQKITNKIYKQTGKGKNEEYKEIIGEYSIDWIPINGKWRKYLIKIDLSS